MVDNGSKDGTVQWLNDQTDIIKIFNSENLGFPKGCNQGIGISTGDNILLLNNDVIVTPNWLDNLTKALYSDAKVGAVGAVTNNAPYYQTVPGNYNNIDELFEFAANFNKSNEALWEPRVKLIGFCMLIKREVVNKIGLLDERFTPGNYEDDDYSYRILSEGYKILLCKDTFVHHYCHTSFKDNNEAFLNLLRTNERKFEEKWGFNSMYSSFIRNEIIDLIDNDITDSINVLEIGCACGATLLKIKDIFKNANLYGIELNESSAKIAMNFANVQSSNIENLIPNYNEKMFDYIIFADVIEHLSDPWKVLKNIKRYLKDDGYILASIPNVMHYSVVRGLINGNWSYQNSGILDKTHLRFFTLNEIIKLFGESGFSEIEYSTTNTKISEADEEFIKNLCALSTDDFKSQFSTYQYIVKAKKDTIIPLTKLSSADTCKLVGISMVKNEMDIIETFVRHNLKFLDELYIMDNSSDDETKNILLKLKEEGLPIFIYDDNELGYSQSEKMTTFSREIYHNINPKYIFFLDADEFLLAASKETLINELRTLNYDTYGLIPWKTYVIQEDNNLNAENIFERIKYRRKQEKPQYYKVILSEGFFNDENNFVCQGNHSLGNKNNITLKHKPLQNVHLGHFPVRSKEQLTSKIIVGWLAYLIKNPKSNETSQGYHWYELYNKIVNGKDLSNSDLHKISLYYAQNENEVIELVEDPINSKVVLNYTTYTNLPLTLVTKMVEKYIINSVKPYIEGDSKTPENHPTVVENNFVDEEEKIAIQRARNNDLYYRETIDKYIDDRINQKTFPLFNKIEIETINRCNNTCPFCPVNKHLDTREFKKMDEKLFNKIIDELAAINYDGFIALFSNNEPLLDERIVEFNRIAREKLPNACLYLYTNATLFTKEKFIELIKYLDFIVLDNYSDLGKLIKPVEDIYELCKENNFYDGKVKISMRKQNELLTTRGGQAKNRNMTTPINSKCILPFSQMIVRPDGKVSLCCNDALGKYTLGDLNEKTILEVWNSNDFTNIRNSMLNGRKNIDLCEFCDTFFIDFDRSGN